MRTLNFKYLFLLGAALVLLGACGRQGNISTDFILEDEKSWQEQETRIYKDPKNPQNTIIEDEYGKTILGPNGEILSQTLDQEAPTSPEYTETTIPEPVSPTQSAEEIQNLVLLPEPEEIQVSEETGHEATTSVEHQHAEEKPNETPETSLWENFSQNSPHGIIEQTDQCTEYPSQRDVMEFGHAIEKLDGTFVDPSDYTKDLIGLTKYLADVGVSHFSAYEMITPGNKTYANSCGSKVLIPNKGCWLRSAAMALVSDKIRGNQGRSVKMTSHYRSNCYNLKVGGSKKSDHLSSRAVDLSFGSKTFRKKAQEYICKTFWKDDLVGLKGLNLEDKDQLNISIGLGQSFMHVGLGSRHGRRYWVYKSYKNGDNKNGTCWTNKL